MTETQIETLFGDRLAELEDVRTIRSYEEEGVLTNNKGLIIWLKDGSEFQITIIKTGENTNDCN